MSTGHESLYRCDHRVLRPAVSPEGGWISADIFDTVQEERRDDAWLMVGVSALQPQDFLRISVDTTVHIQTHHYVSQLTVVAELQM